MDYTFINLKTRQDLHGQAANWFSEKWGLDSTMYLESIRSKDLVPSWFIMLDNNNIIGGAGVIENDFHNRPDLTPNLCALYVEKNYRGQRLGQKILNQVCDYFDRNGKNILYLITDHIGLYEKYNWKFETLVQDSDTKENIRLYSYKS